MKRICAVSFVLAFAISAGATSIEHGPSLANASTKVALDNYHQAKNLKPQPTLEKQRHPRKWKPKPVKLLRGTASWYDDAGATASGFHAHYGVAVCGSGGGPCVPFGTKILFVYHGRRVVAVADDHGPYVSGRMFDLNQNVASALGFDGVDTVYYHIY